MPQTLPQFDALRRRAQMDASAQNDQTQEALKRKFAAQGGLNSGAFIKTSQIAQDQNNQQAQQSLDQIGMQEQAEMQRQKEVQDQRNFATSERLGSQDFSKSLADRDEALKREQFDKQFGLARDEFDQSKFANMMNGITALKNADINGDEMNYLKGVYGALQSGGNLPSKPQGKFLGIF